MDYKVLSEEERDDIVVDFLLAQERDEYAHQLNLDRYNQMLKSIPEGTWKSRITELRDQTTERLAEVRSIIAATKPQLPPAERIRVAKSRLSSRQAIPKA